MFNFQSSENIILFCFSQNPKKGHTLQWVDMLTFAFGIVFSH